MAPNYAYTLLNGQAERFNTRSIRHIGILAIALGSVLGVFWYWDTGAPRTHATVPPIATSAEEDDGVCRFTRAPSRHLGGEPGFQTFENVGYFNRTFYFFGDDDSLPKEADFMSGTQLGFADSSFTPESCISGTTLLSNEGANSTSWNGLWHYYHFTIENILGGYAGGALAEPRPAVPVRLVIPWVDGWHDKWGMNDAVTKAIFGDEVIDKAQWELMSRQAVFFSKLIFVDRWAAHRNSKLVEVWHKMPVQVFETLIKRPNFSHFFDTARDKVHAYFEVTTSLKSQIAYIDRQSSSRKIPDEDHVKLLADMKALAKEKDWDFAHLILENMKPEEQFREVSKANVLIGVHGNGLTHLMWLPANSAVIELFPSHVFQRDYQTAAGALGFDYTAVCGSRIVTQTNWEADPGNKNGPKLQDGTLVDVSIPLVMEHLTAAVNARTK